MKNYWHYCYLDLCLYSWPAVGDLPHQAKAQHLWGPQAIQLRDMRRSSVWAGVVGQPQNGWEAQVDSRQGWETTSCTVCAARDAGGSKGKSWKLNFAIFFATCQLQFKFTREFGYVWLISWGCLTVYYFFRVNIIRTPACTTTSLSFNVWCVRWGSHP